MGIAEEELQYQLALWRAGGVGPRTFFALQDKFPRLATLFHLSSDELRAFNISNTLCEYLQHPDWQGVEKDLAWLSQEGHYIVTIQDSHYPFLLKQIANPPPLLFVQGNINCLASNQLAIVGSRNPTATGSETAYLFARELSEYGLIITSGMALGIDGASHQGALANHSKTIAIFGAGPDIIYPKRHQALADTILAYSGALVTEFPTGVLVRPDHFPRRNRIVSGLSLGVLIVEATLRSGSLITAKLATEQGREVFAIPGSIHNPLSRGCHHLLRQGAKLVETSKDVLEELDHFDTTGSTQTASSFGNKQGQDQIITLDSHCQMLLEYIGFEPTSIDTLVQRSCLKANEVVTKLVVLELAGHVSAVAGGYIRRIGNAC